MSTASTIAPITKKYLMNFLMSPKRRKKQTGPLGVGPQGRGRFNNAEPTIWNGEDLDIPTFLRRNINLDV